MKNNFYKLMSIGLLFCASNSFVSAQTTNPCATTEFTQQLRAQYPQLEHDFELYNQSLMMTSRSTAAAADTVTHIIPVVFHIMHVNGTENISDAQVFAQINRLNLDYSKRNADTSAVMAPFDTLIANLHIQFRLAQIDPNGNCTNGIDRIYTHKTFQADDASKVNQWPREKYLNVWVVHDIAGSTSTATILGFAHFPSDVSGPLFIFDGIIAVYNTINGTSRTLTHEIGHYLNLQHTWGSTNDAGVACGDDQVNDTPPTKGHFSTCPMLDAACTLNPFTTNFKFDNVTTTSGPVDPTPVPTTSQIVGAAITNFKAIGVAANSSTNGKFEFAGWDTGAPDGAAAYSALTGAINTSKYYEVKFDPQLQYNMKYTSVNFMFSRNATGVRTFAVRSSRDGFAANIAAASAAVADSNNLVVKTGNIFFLKTDTTASINSGKITITSALYSNDTMPVTFRFYAWNAEDAAGTFALDSVNFVGSSDLIENVQNIMDYSSCTNMFTLEQGARMRAALESSTSHRDNLWSAANLVATGITSPGNCIPHPEFYSDRIRVCKGDVVKFTKNVEYGTETSRTWRFEGGTPATSTATGPVTVTYSTPGLYKVSLTATNATGTDSVVKTNYIRVDEDWADIDYSGAYTEDFQNTTNFYYDWQVNNYDNNAFTWAVSNDAGYSSSKSVVMQAYGDYQYDVDDLVSPSYDLSYTSGNTLTFKCAAASHATAAADINDKLNVYVSVNCGQSWNLRGSFHDSTLINNGYQANYFIPGSSTVWTQRTVVIPASFATANTRFKFEYTSGTSSNNVYLDDINLQGVVGINENVSSAYSLAIYPNPTSDNSTIAYHLEKKADTKITVTDVLGKTVYLQAANGQAEGDYSITISKQNQNLRNGIYFVRLTVGNESITKKLIITQ